MGRSYCKSTGIQASNENDKETSEPILSAGREHVVKSRKPLNTSLEDVALTTCFFA